MVEFDTMFNKNEAKKNTNEYWKKNENLQVKLSEILEDIKKDSNNGFFNIVYYINSNEFSEDDVRRITYVLAGLGFEVCMEIQIETNDNPPMAFILRISWFD